MDRNRDMTDWEAMGEDLAEALRVLFDEAKDWQEVMNGERPSLDKAMTLAEQALGKFDRIHGSLGGSPRGLLVKRRI